MYITIAFPLEWYLQYVKPTANTLRAFAVDLSYIASSLIVSASLKRCLCPPALRRASASFDFVNVLLVDGMLV